MEFVLTDSSVNTYGFRVLTQGLDISQFKKNPVMLVMHNRMALPIGRWENIRVENDKLIAEAKFDEEHEFAQQIKSKVEQKILSAASIGFDVLEISEDKEDLVKGQTRPTVTKSVLKEASIVDIPGNNNSLRLSFPEKNLQLSGDIPDSILNTELPYVNQKSLKMSEITKELNLPDDATESQVVEAIQTLKAKSADKEESINALMALAESKGLPTNHLKKWAEKDFPSALAYVKEAEAKKERAESGQQHQPQDNGDRLSAALEKLAQGGGQQKNQPQKSLRELEKENPDEVARLIKNEPENYKKLFKDQYGTEPDMSTIKL